MNRATKRGDEGSPRACKRRSTGTRGQRKPAARSLRARYTARKMTSNQLESELNVWPRQRRIRLPSCWSVPKRQDNCSPSVSRCIDVDAGEAVFRQNGSCKGLYVVVSGDFVRKAERLQMRVTLGTARPGDLVELAAALGDGHHTYTLTR
jgi:CRP-like cAMP-binding protein